MYSTIIMILIEQKCAVWTMIFSAMVAYVFSCHVLPEKIITRNGLCQGPQLMLPDVGPCGNIFPEFLEDLSFKIYFHWAEDSKTYILLMLDPDAPMMEYPLLADYVHWIIADIPGRDLRFGVVSPLQSKELVVYRPPLPPPGSGFHRYQLFLFETPEDTTAADYIGYKPSSRARFNLTEFTLFNNLCFNLRATYEFSHEEAKYAMNHLVPKQHV